MPIDPRISLGIQQLQLTDPLAQYGQEQNILAAQAQRKAAGTQNELAQAQLGQAKMSIKEAQEAQDYVAQVMAKAKENGAATDDPMDAAMQMLRHPNAKVREAGKNLFEANQTVLAYQQDKSFANRTAPQPIQVTNLPPAPGAQPILAYDDDSYKAYTEAKTALPFKDWVDQQNTKQTNALAPAAAAPAPVNALAAAPAAPSRADQILEKINDLRTRFPFSAKAKEEITFLIKQYEEANKAYTVAPGGALVVGGKEVYKAEEKDSDFEKLLSKTNLTDDEKKAMRLSKAKKDATHAPSAQQNVYAFTPASVEAQKQFVQTASDERKQLRNAPDALKNIQAAKKLIPTASTFMGKGGEPLLAAASFLNNRLGFGISTQGVTDATVLRTRLFEGILENLKKLDSQPSQEQQRVLSEALGNLGTDPAALEQILDRIAETVEDRVSRFNTDVSEAEARGVKFPFKPQITLPPKALSPKAAADQIPGQSSASGGFKYLGKE
jgi:hypothetical protein